MDDFNVAWSEEFANASDIYDAPRRSFIAPARVSPSKRLSIVEPKKKHISNAVRRKFASYLSQWRKETMFKSSSHDIYFNLSYQRIIGMGSEALPLIREQLEAANGDWFWALSCIAGLNPVPEEKWGNIEEQTRIWLNWLDKNA